MKTILVTGASGYVGQQLVSALLKKNYDVKCFVRDQSSVKKFYSLPVQFRFGDLTSQESLEKSLHNVDVVIHLAALTSSIHDDSFFHVNYFGARNLLAACKKESVRRIIVVSSMAAARQKRDAYGESKLQADFLFLHSGLDITILRPTLIYGKRSPAMQRIVNHIHSFPFIIPLIGNGKCPLSPVHIDDVLFAILSSLQHDQSIGKVYSLIGKGSLNFNSFIDLLCQQFSIKKYKIHFPLLLCSFGARIARFLYPRFFLSSSFITSIGSEYLFCSDDAESDLGYTPRAFREGVHDL